MSDVPTVDVHPGGDVILICGQRESERRLRVSSIILQHASSVFRAMLGPHFREGSTLATASSVDIPLPDDDPDCMEFICYLLHMRNDDAPSRLEAEDLIAIADHCDKYDVYVATRPAINLWFDACSIDPSKVDLSTTGRLMEVAFELRLWKHVTRFGIIMVQQEGINLRTESEKYSCIPFYIFDQLERLRIQTLYKLHSAAGEEIDRVLSHRNLAGKCTGECEGANAHKMHLLHQLRRNELWPWTPNDWRSPIELVDGMNYTRVTNMGKAKKCGDACTVTTIQGARGVVMSMRSAMRQVLDKMESEIEFDPDEEDDTVLGFYWA